MGKTIAEKILSKACKHEVKPGDFIYPDPDLVILTDTQVYDRVMTMKAMGISRLSQPEKYVIPLGHLAVSNVAKANIVKGIREIVGELGIIHFFDQGYHGVEHSIAIEKALVRPGMLIFGGDTHQSTVGAVSALGIPLPFELLSLLISGTTWIRVPETIRVRLEGRLPVGVLCRDVIHWLIKDIGPDNANYRVLEFSGSAFEHIGIDGRMTLCNVPVQIGAKSAIIEPDNITEDYIRTRSSNPVESVRSDQDAEFIMEFIYDISQINPMIALPPNPDNVLPVEQVAGIKIQRAVIGSCANGMLDDLKVAAGILANRKVHPNVRLVICPATQKVFLNAAQERLIEIFLGAGATIMEPGCPICYGAVSPLASGEICITTTARNEPGRMGSAEAEIYLASPATVAASAVKGEIADPRDFF
jgi:3-isopropylmalate/(R)-2-methylmalate dehydratase large subunit